MTHHAARQDIELPVGMVVGESGEAFSGYTVNISETGILVLSQETRPPGTLVQLDFPAFQGLGEVVWTQEADAGRWFLGMRFLSFERRGRELLTGLLSDPRG